MSDEFQKIQLSMLADITMGQSPDSINYNDDEKGLAFLQGCADFGFRYPTPQTYVHPPLKLAKKNSVLVSVRAPVGKINWSDRDYCIGRGLCSVKAKENNADTSFLKYALIQNEKFLHRRSQGSTFLAISFNDLSIFPIPDITVNVQKKIALILETIDQVIEKTETLIQKYQQIKQGLMHDLFTRGVTSDGKLRPTREQAPELYKETPIGWIPKEWEYLSIGKYTESWAMGPRFSAEEYNENGNVATLRTTDIDQAGHIEYSTMPIATLKIDTYKSHLLKKGDFVITRSGTCGICAVFASFSKAVLPGAFLIRFRFNRNLSEKYVKNFFNSECGKPLIQRVTEGGVQKDLRGTSFHNINFPCPILKEQKRINLRIHAINKKIIKEQTLKVKLLEQKLGLMKDLLTGRVRVKVD